MHLDNERLLKFGLNIRKGGTHSRRTMMFRELSMLFESVSDRGASKEEYIRMIRDENCLAKRSGATRGYTAQYLIELYGLDPEYPVFRALRYLWDRDVKGRPLIALLCAYVRDGILRDSSPYILDMPVGQQMDKEEFQSYFDSLEPGRFGSTTLASVVRNLSSSWTQSGHLTGRTTKNRTQVEPTPGAVSFAMFLGYICGIRGKLLFESDFVRLLDCSYERALELSGEASRAGWIVLKAVGDVVEVAFPRLLTPQELGEIQDQY